MAKRGGRKGWRVKTSSLGSQIQSGTSLVTDKSLTFGSDGLSTSSDRSFFSRSRSCGLGNCNWTKYSHSLKLQDCFYTFFLSLSDLSLSLLTERPEIDIW